MIGGCHESGRRLTTKVDKGNFWDDVTVLYLDYSGV